MTKINFDENKFAMTKRSLREDKKIWGKKMVREKTCDKKCVRKFMTKKRKKSESNSDSS